jgi:two-component system, NarL family, nitrate/nitrite response regulator NarL
MVMARRTATVIIEPHLLVREALESLIKKYRYRVVRSVASTAELDNSAIADDGPRLVVLGGESTDDAVAEAVIIRKLWSNSKIVLLFERASIDDFQKLLASEVDGCVPLFASPETLIRTLDLVTIEDARVVVTGNAKNPAIRRSPTGNSRQMQAGTSAAPSGNTEDGSGSIGVVSKAATRPIGNGFSTAQSNGHNADARWALSLPNGPRLSEREAQILNGLVQGHANKVIARTCDITEATVKVHMKSILRKIQVANRTQAAVWALEHGHSVYPIKDR